MAIGQLTIPIMLAAWSTTISTIYTGFQNGICLHRPLGQWLLAHTTTRFWHWYLHNTHAIVYKNSPPAPTRMALQTMHHWINKIFSYSTYKLSLSRSTNYTHGSSHWTSATPSGTNPTSLQSYPKPHCLYHDPTTIPTVHVTVAKDHVWLPKEINLTKFDVTSTTAPPSTYPD